MHIALAFDDNYAVHARVLIESILHETGRDTGSEMEFWLASPRGFDDPFEESVRGQVGDRAEVHFLPPDPRVFDLPLSTSEFGTHVTHAMYTRLLIPLALPDHVDRFAYIDSDALCTASLAGLTSFDLNGRPVGAVRDIYTRRFADQGYLPGMDKYPHLNPMAEYFNSGMMVVDTVAWKRARVTERAIAYLDDNRDNTRFADQDALNFVLHEQWHRLPRKWNHMMSWRLEPEIGGRLADAALIHCPGRVKFWTDEFPANSARRAAYWRHRTAAGL